MRSNAIVTLAAAAALLAAACSDSSPSGGFADSFVLGDSGAVVRDLGAGGDSDGASTARDASGAPSPLALAAHWAPVWYQDVDDSDTKADFIVAYDFDGDTRSDNNWDNLHASNADLRAVIYYSVVESQTHYFILYTDFHPRDWDENCKPIPFGPDRCHENDLEGAMVVARKTPGKRFGTFEVLYTEAHNKLYIFTSAANAANVSKRSGRLLSSRVTFEDGSHPKLYVESKGHGVCALSYPGGEHCKHPVASNPFPGGDGIVYRYKGGVAERPRSGDDRDVGYKLVSFRETLWKRRADICDNGCTFDKEMTYEGIRLGRAFDGDDHKDDAANPPWGWDDPGDGDVFVGDFFFKPAHTLRTHLALTGPLSTRYVRNPFLGKSSP